MSRINKAAYLLAMLGGGGSIQSGEDLSECFRDFTNVLKPKSLYFYTFKKLFAMGINKKIRDWADEHGLNEEPYATAVNPYGAPVYFYEF